MLSSENKHTILVVDDSSSTLEVMQRNLTMEGYEVSTASGVIEAIDFLENNPVDIIITDYMMPKIRGYELIRHVRENYRNTEIIMITGYASVEGAVEAMKVGAGEYLAKPFTDQELLNAVKSALEKLKLRTGYSRQSLKDLDDYSGIIGKSEPVRELQNIISKVSGTKSTVLITGESGTGKELVARAIHYMGKSSHIPFISVNCGGIPESLFARELFGYVKGAFNEAAETRSGFFEQADGGTIFLNEIGESSLETQEKILKVLEDKSFSRIGEDDNQINIDVRVIAATNKDLALLVQKGAFNENLFSILNTVTIQSPPLRERGDDILILAQHFASKYSQDIDRPTPEFAASALNLMRSYHWPGNIRELRNVVQRLIVMNDGSQIEAPDLPSLMRNTSSRISGFNRTLEEVEIDHIHNVLAHVDNNKSQAAKILGINRKTLHRKISPSEKSE